ncbi:MAG: nucleotidyl transferase AbiEii/AbiGii toxin family protein [Verrucomicrobiota bacterium]
MLELAERAHEAELEFILIGGHAVAVVGRARSTRDVDFLVRKNDVERWKSLLGALDFSVAFERAPFVQFSSSEELPLPEVDLMVVDEDTFQQFVEEAVEFPGTKGELQVAGPVHLIALKLHAMKSREGALREQDWADILSIAEKNNLQPDESPLREIIDKHGPEGIRDRWP